MELYEPINTLKPAGEDLWAVDGPHVELAFPGGSVPVPTRMVVVRLAGGDLLLWSPTEPDERLRKDIDALGGVVDPDGKAPPEIRLSFLGRKEEGRASLEKMIAWRPEKVIMAHGRPYERDGTAEVRRAFRWLGSKG